MKSIEQILKDAGVELTENQSTSIKKAVAENYKTIADYDKQKQKLTTAEQSLAAANETIKGFEGGMSAEDVEKLKKDHKAQLDNVKAEAAKNLLRRDQADYLKGEYDRLGITSPLVRDALSRRITDEKEGLKWVDGSFQGLADYLEKENSTNHFYKTEEEKKAEEQGEKAAGKVPKITDPSKGKSGEQDEPADIPVIF